MLIEGRYNAQRKQVAVDADGRLLVSGAAAGGSSGGLTDEELRASAVPVSLSAAASATITRTTASATSVTLLAANADRKGVVIYNDTAAAELFVKFGATASATSYTVKLGPGDLYESPANPIYTGVIDGLWSAAEGAAQVTEL